MQLIFVQELIYMALDHPDTRVIIRSRYLTANALLSLSHPYRSWAVTQLMLQ